MSYEDSVKQLMRVERFARAGRRVSAVGLDASFFRLFCPDLAPWDAPATVTVPTRQTMSEAMAAVAASRLVPARDLARYSSAAPAGDVVAEMREIQEKSFAGAVMGELAVGLDASFFRLFCPDLAPWEFDG